MPLKTDVTPIINLAAKMNTRANNETLDVDANETGIELTYLQNGDLFYTKSLTSREGITDILGGVVNASGSPVSIINTKDNLPSGSTVSWVTNFGAGTYYDYIGTIIIPSGNTNIFQGDLTIRGVEGNLSNPNLSQDVLVSMRLYKLDQTNVPSLGVSYMSGTSSAPNNIVHNIGISGNYNAPPYPAYDPAGSFSFIPPDPIAETTPVQANLGSYSLSGVQYYTAEQTFDWQFNAPFLLRSGSVYFLQHWIRSSPSGTNSGRGYQAKYNYNTYQDISPNTALLEEFMYIGAPANQTNALRPLYASGSKAWISQDIKAYQSPNYMLVDNPTSYYNQSSPLVSGTYTGAPVFPMIAVTGSTTWQGTLNTPSCDTTNVEFGQVITLPSGDYTINGAYFYANTFSGNTDGSYPTTFFTQNRAVINPSGYNAGYFCHFSEITSATGSMVSGTYNIDGRTILASFSGNHVFSNPVNQYNTLVNGVSTNLDKLYGIFDNVVNISITGNTDYLVSFGWFDFSTGAQNTDYSVNTQAPTTWFGSPFKIGMETGNTYSGTYVYNWNNNGQSFTQANYSGNSGGSYDLTCGVLSFQSGNAITSIYDYRIGDRRTQEIIFTQRDKVQTFADYDPINTVTTLWTGAAIGDIYKWSHSTFQNLLFSHQYSQSSGLCWDQIYYNPSGLTMQYHGLQPRAVLASGMTITPPSGVSAPANINTYDFDVILATTMNSGGFRASEVIHFSGNSAAGTGTNAIQLQGPYNSGISAYMNIQNTGINTGAWQYNFDVNSLGTYVFTTQPSGAVFFLADLVDVSGNRLPNPLGNIDTFRQGVGQSGVYIYDISYTGSNTEQVPNAINYDQNYLINQVPVPKFKKTIVFKNLLIGIGDPDNPSRLWYSEQQAPQIWGVDSNFYGYYDVDNENGQGLTGIEIFKDYLIIFKENSTYRASYTANPGNPLDIFQVSSNKGCLGIFTTVSTDYGVIGLNQYGPFLASYAGNENIGDEIYNYYQDLDRTELIFAVAIHDPARQQIYWSISSSDDSPDNQKGLVYSYAEKAWGTRQNGMWNAAGRIGDVDNFSKYYIGDTFGQVKQLNSGDYDQDILFVDTTNTDLTKNISMVIETPWLNFGNSQNLKQIKYVKVNCETSNQRLRVDVYTDQNDTVKKYSRYLNMNVPVINRVCSLSGVCRTLKLVLTSIGQPDQVKINSLQIGYIDMGMSTNIM
jgi:hypothetical protein